MAHPARPFRPPHSPGAGSPEPTEPTKPTAQARAPQGSGHSGPGVPGRMADAETAAAPASDARAGGWEGGGTDFPARGGRALPIKVPRAAGGAGPGRGGARGRVAPGVCLGWAWPPRGQPRGWGGGQPREPEARGRCPCCQRQWGQTVISGAHAALGGAVFSRRAVAEELETHGARVCGSVYHVVVCGWSLLRPRRDLGPQPPPRP